MKTLYERAKRGQWNGDDLAWHTNVDPYDPNVPMLPDDFLGWDRMEARGIKLDLEGAQRSFVTAW